VDVAHNRRWRTSHASAAAVAETLGDRDLPLFDPERGRTIATPEGEGDGWWTGAPGAWWDGSRFWVTYRVRRPKPERGCEIRLVSSQDGEHFEPVWTMHKEQFGSPSLERSALVQDASGRWLLFVSYVDPDDDRWRIDLIEAAAPDALDPAARGPVLTADDAGGEGVKDPWVCQVDDEWQMLVSHVPTPDTVDDPSRLHASQDVFNTGLSRSMTGLATSRDGRTWDWRGTVLEPAGSDDWDAYAARLSALIRLPEGLLGFYDGAHSVEENYEERCGLVAAGDLHGWQRLDDGGPSIGARIGPGSVRYVDAIQGPHWVRYFYEFTREDGSHDLRTALLDLPGR
jgi:hypothetical protein